MLMVLLKREMISGQQLPGKKRNPRIRSQGLAREFRLGPLIDRWCVFVRAWPSECERERECRSCGREEKGRKPGRESIVQALSLSWNTGFSNYKLIDRAYISLTMAASTPRPPRTTLRHQPRHVPLRCRRRGLCSRAPSPLGKRMVPSPTL